MQNQLAIVIPAYKVNFLRNALESINNQTCKDFNLYIGDDASQEDILGVVNRYKEKLNIFYYRFQENLGKINLTQQWARCISLTKCEPYIWLFSDDDEMSENAVYSFLQEVESTKNYYDLYRFNLITIDENSRILNQFNYKEIVNVREFFKSRILRTDYSCITQYIFKRSTYLCNRGFVSFPLGWFSDDATVINFAKKKGIKLIQSGFVKWRLAENVNISASYNYSKEKSQSVFEYCVWFNKMFQSQFEKKEFKEILMFFLKYRLLYMPINERLRLKNIKNLASVLSWQGMILIYFNTFYCNFKMWLINLFIKK